MSFIKLVAIAAAVLTAAAAPAANLVVNGDFEASASGALPAGFAATPSTGVVTGDGQAYADSLGATGGVTALGNHFAVFGNNTRGAPSTLTQLFASEAGRSYDLTFDFGAFGVGRQRFDLVVTDVATSQVLASLQLSDVATTDLDAVFGHFASSFVATGAQTRLSFANRGQNDLRNRSLLDNVAIFAAPVPEPATWAMMLAGFGLVGGTLRSRKPVAAIA